MPQIRTSRICFLPRVEPLISCIVPVAFLSQVHQRVMRAFQESLVLHSLFIKVYASATLTVICIQSQFIFLRLHITYMKEMYMKKYMGSFSGAHKMPSHVHEMSHCATAYSSSW